MTQDQWEVDREAIEQFHVAHFRNTLDEAVKRGEWTTEEADKAHSAFEQSDALQSIVDSDVERLTMQLNGRMH